MYEFFQVLELSMKKNFLTILRFYDPFLRSEFILYFPCRVKNVFLTTLLRTPKNSYMSIILYSKYLLHFLK
jgi:hypothetical protein